MSLRPSRNLLLLLLLFLCLFLSQCQTQSLKLRLRTLIICGDCTAQAVDSAQSSLRFHSIPFTVSSLLERSSANSPFVPVKAEKIPVLVDGDTGLFNSILLADGLLGYDDTATGLFLSSVPTGFRAALADYQVRFGVRVVHLLESIKAPGLAMDGFALTAAPQVRNVTLSFTDALPTVTTALARSAVLDARGVYMAPVAAESAQVLASRGIAAVTPVVLINSTTVGAAVVRYVSGAEKLLIFVDHSPQRMYTSVLAVAWIDWVTRGLHVGLRRLYVNLHVDDLFLSTRTWSPSLLARGETAYRSSPSDLESLAQWSRSWLSRLPSGSNFSVTHAFNGNGVALSGGVSGDPVFAAARRLLGEFLWCTHTFSHANLDVVSESRARFEITENLRYAEALFRDTGLAWRWSYTGMVPPAITGIFNGDGLRGLWGAGIRYMVGDNTRGELVNPASELWAVRTNAADNGFAGMTVVPRFSTFVFFDTSLPEENLSEYCFTRRLAPNCTGSIGNVYDLDIVFSSVHKANFRRDAFMFHQANLRFFKGPDGARTCLLCMWGDKMLGILSSLFSLPVLSSTLHDDAEAYLGRESLDRCLPEAVVLLPGPLPAAPAQVSVTARGPAGSTCAVPITGLLPSSYSDAARDAVGSAASAAEPRVRFERYGAVTTGWFSPVVAGQPAVVARIPAAVDVAVSSAAPLPQATPYATFAPTFVTPLPGEAAASALPLAANAGDPAMTAVIEEVSFANGTVLIVSAEMIASGRPLAAVSVRARDSAGNAVQTGGLFLACSFRFLGTTGEATSHGGAIEVDTPEGGGVDPAMRRARLPLSREAVSAGAPALDITDHGNGTYTFTLLYRPAVWGSWAMDMYAITGPSQLTVPLSGIPRVITFVAPAPKIVSLVADDPGYKTAGFGPGDTLAITFDVPTSAPSCFSKASCDLLFAWSHPLGSAYTGAWGSDNQVLTVTVLNITGAAPSGPPLGAFTATPVAWKGYLDNQGIRRYGDLSESAWKASPPLAGSWAGRKRVCLACWLVPSLLGILIVITGVWVYTLVVMRRRAERAKREADMDAEEVVNLEPHPSSKGASSWAEGGDQNLASTYSRGRYFANLSPQDKKEQGGGEQMGKEQQEESQSSSSSPSSATSTE